MAYEFGADGSIINTEPTNPSVKKQTEKEMMMNTVLFLVV